MIEGYERIVVGVDGSPSSHQALLWAAHMATLMGASLQVIACWESPTTEVWEIPPAFDSGDGARRTLEETVAEAFGDDPGIDIDITVVEGQAGPVLLRRGARSVAPCGGWARPPGVDGHTSWIGERALRDPRSVPGHCGARCRRPWSRRPQLDPVRARRKS